MAATRTRTESSVGTSIAEPIKPGQHEEETPARRTTTRTRKLPSRLLPSPSPPPTRPTPSYAKPSKADTPVLPSTPTVVIPQSHTKTKRPSPSLDQAVVSDHESVDADASVDDLGPGKRKRRPSSMYRPPSTLTADMSSKSKKKGRSTSPDIGVGVTKLPSNHAPVTYGKKRRSSKAAFNGKRHGASELSDDGADDSEMEFESAARYTKKTRHAHTEDGSGLSPPPLLPRDGSTRIQMPAELTQPTFTRGGQVSVSPESCHKRARLAGRSFARNDDGIKDGLQSIWRANELPSSPQSPAVSRFEHCSLTRPSFTGATRTQLRSNNVTFDMGEDEEEDEDEDDFHQAMLNADLDFFDSQKTELASAGSWLLTEPPPSDQDMDDTPATTPRSPQSGCDPPTPGSPTFKAEDAVEEVPSKGPFVASRDTVFVHALPTTQVGANKPHQHAGSLTLSLPYSPEVAASSPQLKAVDVERDPKSFESKTTPRLSTPILQRRKYGGPSHGLSALKFGSEAIERAGASHFMQLSPMIELDSPLLSPGLSLSLNGKGPDPPSPFVIGVSALPDLDQPAPLALPPSKDSVQKADKIEASRAAPTESSAKDGATVQPKHEMMALKRPALPPPRQIRFTTFTTADVASAKPQQQPQPPATRRSTVLAQTQPKAVKVTRSSTTDQTPDLIYSGSSSPDSVSESASPLSRSDSDSYADAEVENILFGPPENLDLRELDQVWGGSKASLSGLVATASDSSSGPTLRRTKPTRIHHVGLSQ